MTGGQGLRLSWTLSRYLGQRFLAGVGGAFLVIGALVFLIEFVELINRGLSRDELTIFSIFGMTLLKVPGTMFKALPFCVLFGAIWSFARLTRSQELVIARSAGLSVWQFGAPALVLSFFIGVLAVTAYNPVSATLLSRFEDLESRFIRGRTSTLDVFKTGVWLRQSDETGQSVIHALRVGEAGQRLEDVVVIRYRGADTYAGRLDAISASLRNGAWTLEDVWEQRPGEAPVHHDSYDLKTQLLPGQIQDSFASPDTISFWDLPGFVATAEAAGFSAIRHRIQFYSLLALPLLLAAMVMIATVFSLRLARFGGVGQLVAAGVATGFLLYFLSDLTQALGLSGLVPALPAAWAPALVAVLLGTAALLYQEDG